MGFYVGGEIIKFEVVHHKNLERSGSESPASNFYVDEIIKQKGLAIKLFNHISRLRHDYTKSCKPSDLIHLIRFYCSIIDVYKYGMMDFPNLIDYNS